MLKWWTDRAWPHLNTVNPVHITIFDTHRCLFTWASKKYYKELWNADGVVRTYFRFEYDEEQYYVWWFCCGFECTWVK